MESQRVQAGYYMIKSAIFGHAVGDALGVPVEFIPRERLLRRPVSNMRGFAVHDVPPGTWSDDTSMTLCTLESLTEIGSFSPDDVMDRFVRWVHSGYMTPCGKAFGIGRTTLQALADYRRGKPAADCGRRSERDNGNGSLMRIIPMILYQHLQTADHMSLEDRLEEICRVSALTHAHMRSMTACGIYSLIMDELLSRPEPASITRGLQRARAVYAGSAEYPAFARMLESGFLTADISQIKSSGYVVDTLEAAVWCAAVTGSYPECVLQAVNLGGDTDTTAAVAGGLAGVLYGFDAIPAGWISILAMHEKLDACVWTPLFNGPKNNSPPCTAPEYPRFWRNS